MSDQAYKVMVGDNEVMQISNQHVKKLFTLGELVKISNQQSRIIQTINPFKLGLSKVLSQRFHD